MLLAQTRVLFVDDEPYVLDALRRSLRRVDVDWDLEFVTSGERALAILDQRPCDVVVTDIMMPGMDGTELLERVEHLHPGTAPVVLSGHCDHAMTLRLIQSGYPFLSKPCSMEHLVATLTMIIDRRSPEHHTDSPCLSPEEVTDAITLLAAGMIRGGLVDPDGVPPFLRDRLSTLLARDLWRSIGAGKAEVDHLLGRDDDVSLDGIIQGQR